MAPRVLILNGPNLGRLGAREPEIYGHADFGALSEACQRWATGAGRLAEVRQTDSEAELIGWLHEAARDGADVVLNPAAFTHYSYAVRDAAAQVTGAGLALIEVHLSNPAARERFRHHSVISAVATGTIAGFGFDSYRLALAALPASAPG